MKSNFSINIFMNILVCLALATFVCADEPFVYRTVVVNNQPVPGLPGLSFGSFVRPPITNSQGTVAFDALLSGAVDESNNEVGISGTADELSLIYREGDPAPGYPAGIVLGDGVNPSVRIDGIDEEGDVNVFSILFGDGIDSTNNLALFRYAGDSSDIIAASGFPVDGLPFGVVLGNMQDTVLSSQGHTVFTTRLSGLGVNEDNDRALIGEIAGAPLLTAREGEPAVGTGADFRDFEQLRVNRFGNVLLLARDSNIAKLIYEITDGVLMLRYFEGEQVPNAGLGTLFQSFALVSFNDAAQIAFIGLTLDGGGSASSGIYSAATGSLEPIAITGMQAPGVLLSQFFGNSFRSLVINGSGETAFSANLTGALVLPSNDSAIFAERDGQLQLVAREGSTALSITERFGDFVLGEVLASNSAGNIAFINNLAGSDVDSTNDEALFMTITGEHHLVAREGDMFDADDDPLNEDLREIESISVQLGSGGQDGLPTGLSETGELVFMLEFTNGSSGIFVAKPSFLLGDVNGDGIVDLLDIGPFVDLITGGGFLPEADINGDGVVNLLDVGPFVVLLTS